MLRSKLVLGVVLVMGFGSFEIVNAGTISKRISPQSKCTDTDGGKDLTKKGAARGIKWVSRATDTTVATGEDTCKDANTVTEYRCVEEDGVTLGDGFLYFNNTACPTDSTCLDGICTTCTDTDASVSPNTAGTVTDGSKQYVDTCCTSGVDCGGYSNSGRVKEYFCNHGHAAASYPACATGKTCQDGACK